MIKLNVTVDMAQALTTLDRVSEEVREKAAMRAINKMADQVKVQASRDIRGAGYNIKIGTIKKAITIGRASSSQLVARVRASGRPIGLINYGARKTRKGVSVQVKNGRKIIPDAFIATMPNGHRGVFVREGATHKKVMTGGRVQWSGLPIRELYGPSIPSAFLSKIVQESLESAVRERCPAMFRHEVEFLRLK
jgi:hypothetical protein